MKNFTRKDCGRPAAWRRLLQGDVDWKAVIAALKRIDYRGAITAEMIPFSRLPNLVLPDMALARKTARQLRKIFL